MSASFRLLCCHAIACWTGECWAVQERQYFPKSAIGAYRRLRAVVAYDRALLLAVNEVPR